MEFDAIAAVAVGGTSFERGNGWLFGTLLGVIAVGVLRNGLNLLAVPSSAQVACIGAIVIIALFIDGQRANDELHLRRRRPIASRALARHRRPFDRRGAAMRALTALSDVFFTTDDILNVLRQTALLFLMASGLTLVILTAGLDLSVGANITLSACLAASVMKATGSPLLGMATGISCGGFVLPKSEAAENL